MSQKLVFGVAFQMGTYIWHYGPSAAELSDKPVSFSHSEKSKLNL